ncbi:MAG: non-canonical purine NTP pyrophosphatase, RdgB/HAM1 family [Candidatus Pelagibacter sp. TMED64]|nr:non-canonical purine NTP pyrophosphatase, RdgB/HAM1 family [Candidatus Pelagibacter sp.]OUU65512.1 MAG: non-canonical purine NTP pyrophosphatase, RdgB/HAM1 family [Candidatus Pelagibacter sp. TMED64]
MKKINKILIGTNNPGKFDEISKLLPKNVEKYSPIDFKILSPKETGKTYEDNSRIKALYYSKKTNLICLSDDSGLEIDLLNGEPGIYSSRWGGPNNNFNVAIEKVFKIIKKKKKNNKIIKAKFICNLTLCWPNKKKIISVEGIIPGRIIDQKKGIKGFGYDPIFVPRGFNYTFGEMSPKLKMSIDHRYKAYNKLKKYFF